MSGRGERGASLVVIVAVVAALVFGTPWTGRETPRPLDALVVDAGPNQTAREADVVAFTGTAQGGGSPDPLLTWAKESGVRVNVGGPYDSVYAFHPHVVPIAGGYRMYYSGNDGSHWRTLSATSTDQVSWTKESGVRVDVGGPYDSVYAYSPEVLRLANGTLRMYYAGSDGSTIRVLSAVSSDGLAWAKESGIRVDAGGPDDPAGALSPHVAVLSSGSLRMYYAGATGSSFRILSATSNDGLIWTKESGIRINPGGPYDGAFVDSAETVLLPSGTLRMFYHGNDGTRSRILSAVSTDGLLWTKESGVRVDVGGPYDGATLGYPELAVSPSGSYRLFYAGSDGSNLRILSAVPAQPALRIWWDFDTGADSDGDGVPDNDVDALGVNVTHVYGDDGTFTAKLCASDGNSTVCDTTSVTVTNVPPTLEATRPSTGAEADSLVFHVRVTDPGSDDLTVRWSGSCSGWSPATVYPNDPNRFPDPDPSPDVHPRDVSESQTVRCGDNGIFSWSVAVSDDDGGVSSQTGTFGVRNIAPSMSVPPPSVLETNEGTLVVLAATVVDPGSDDLTFSWNWQYGPDDVHVHYNDGVGPDPPNSPNGTYPFIVPDDSLFTYGDDGSYSVALVASDDDGGTVNGQTSVVVRNVAPTVDAGPDRAADEGDFVPFAFAFTDPGFDQPAAGSSEDFTATVDWGDGTQETLVVNEVPGGPGTPTRGSMSGVHVFADDGAYLIAVRVCDDDGGCGADVALAAVGNVAPTVDAGPDWSVDEGSLLNASFVFLDPGFDFPPAGTSEDFNASVDWGDTVLDDYGVDEVPGSPGVPTTGTVRASHVYADDGAYAAIVTVCDDDGGCGQDEFYANVANVPPSVEAGPNRTADEGSRVPFESSFSDPGFDFVAAGTSEDFVAFASWGDGTGESLTVLENPGSPGVPTTGTVPATHIYADNGAYEVILTVCDDDGGCGSDSTVVIVENVAPRVQPGLDQDVEEAAPVSTSFAFSDPGFDFPIGGTWENFTATIDWGYGPEEGVPVEEVPGAPGVPTTGSVNATHVYGDNGVFSVTATVCDDDGGCGSATLRVTVNNVAPTIPDVQAYVAANVTLRVAGEKWHDVRMDLVWDGNVTGTVRVVRMPGSPDRQSGTIEGAHLQLLGSFSITLYYTPDDDPVNGQPNGANPAWVIVAPPGEDEIRLHHTFNVQHPDTWTWTIDDLRPYLIGHKITFDATAHDVGSDDLAFAWTFGDGATAGGIYYNNGVGPDPYPSPEVNPITAHDVQAHAYAVAGTYTVTLTVTDDDGGTAVATWVAVVRG